MYFILWALLFISATTTYADNVTSIIKNISEQTNQTIPHEDSEFPEDLFTEEQRKHGAIILHIIFAIYSFIAIAIVCTNYFMPTIRCICNSGKATVYFFTIFAALKLSDDVAAATFMSIATSSPELFTNIIGTFISDSDIGIGNVLGNAYYDMFFVASLGGLAASQNIILDWWPITRDCIIYMIVALTLTWVVWDGYVETYETIILLALYLLYFFIMFKNRAIIRYLRARFGLELPDPLDAEYNVAPNTEVKVEDGEELLSNRTHTKAPQVVGSEKDGATSDVVEKNQIFRGDKNGSRKLLQRISQLLLLPINTLIYLTIPDVRISRWRQWYPLSFILCVVWIGISTYLGTWMISVIGQTVGVPDIIMGMVFMAAGGSVVEAYGVYYKARRGECSIGLSNSMGCNTMDVTMCLALPWLIKSLLPSSADAGVELASKVLHVNCVLLVMSVIVIYGILYANSFQLNYKLGISSGAAYITIMAIAISVETHHCLLFTCLRACEIGTALISIAKKEKVSRRNKTQGV